MTYFAGLVSGLVIAWLFGRGANWMMRRSWDSDPSEAAQQVRAKLFGKMTYEQLLRLKIALEAEMARRLP